MTKAQPSRQNRPAFLGELFETLTERGRRLIWRRDTETEPPQPPELSELAQALLSRLFWRGQDGRLTGWLRERVARLMAHDLSLFAYHLPLDAHPELGNNAQLGRRLGLAADARFGDQQLGFAGPAGGIVLETLAGRAGQALGRAPLVVPGDGRPLRRVAWCTGGAQGYFEAAIAAGADAFLTGEISEPQAHLARETGVAFLACGHHATERFGAPAVGEHVAERLGLAHRFIEIANPA